MAWVAAGDVAKVQEVWEDRPCCSRIMEWPPIRAYKYYSTYYMEYRYGYRWVDKDTDGYRYVARYSPLLYHPHSKMRSR